MIERAHRAASSNQKRLFPPETTAHEVAHLLRHFFCGRICNGFGGSIGGGLLHVLSHGLKGVVESSTVFTENCVMGAAAK